jgi:hypothetical protein
MTPEDQPPGIAVPVAWLGVEDVPILLANAFVSQFDAQTLDSLTLTVGQVTMPAIMGATEEVEFPRFGGHRLTERRSVGKDVCHAEDAVVFTGVPFGGCQAVAEQRSFGPAAGS